jgi:translation initiation factor RLI1
MWLSVTDAKKKYNKSESSIRRVIKELKQKDLTQLQFETLSNGIDRILINEKYLDGIFNRQKNDINSSHSDSHSNDMFSILVEQLKMKDEELQRKDEQISQLHILMGGLQNKVLQLDDPKTKKRWWNRNK